MEAVTTYVRAWRCAARAPARSIQCIRRPPKRAPSTFASLGRTNSDISDCESRTGRASNALASFMMDDFALRIEWSPGLLEPGCHEALCHSLDPRVVVRA